MINGTPNEPILLTGIIQVAIDTTYEEHFTRQEDGSNIGGQPHEKPRGLVVPTEIVDYHETV